MKINGSEMERIEDWRIHVGAHKTATTHLQDTLLDRREWLAEQGLDYLPMQEVRDLGLPPHPGKFGWRTRLPWLMRRKIKEAIAPLRAGPPVILISEENFLGRPADMLGEKLYPDAVRRLKPFLTLSTESDLHCFLSIRRPDKIMASAYVEELRQEHIPGGFDPIRNAALEKPPRWSELIGRLLEAFPRAKLSVWTFEDYLSGEDKVLSNLCGIPVPPATSLPNPVRTRSPSLEAIKKFERLDPTLVWKARAEAAQKIVEEDNGTERFKPFSNDEIALFQQAYEIDQERMARQFPGVLFRPSLGG